MPVPSEVDAEAGVLRAAGGARGKRARGRDRERRQQSAARGGAGGRSSRAGAPQLQDFRQRASRLPRWVMCLGATACIQAILGLWVWVLSPAAFGRGQVQLAAASLTAFAAPNAPLPASVKKAAPSNIAVLVVASGLRPGLLRDCLNSLQQASGFQARSVLVAQAASGQESQEYSQNSFGVGWVGPVPESVRAAGGGASANPAFAAAASPQKHYQRSLDYAVNKYFVDQRYKSIFVLEEDMIVAPDVLWYMAQLESVLHTDETLWCATAWNDNALSAYVADPTTVMRTDWFGAVGWMLPTVEIAGLVAEWPDESIPWRVWMRQEMIGRGQQCLFPEIPRVAFSILACSDGSFKCGEDTEASRLMSAQSVMNSRPVVNLGDVQRLKKDNYRELFMSGWPAGQGLLQAEAIDSLSKLEGLLGYTSFAGKTSWRQPALVHVTTQQKSDGRTDDGSGASKISWSSVAMYFGLPHDGPRCAYEGVIRLWWRDTTLFIVLDTSSLLSELWLPSAVLNNPFEDWDFEHRNRNLHEPPPRAVPPQSVVASTPTGMSCSKYCGAMQGQCVDADLAWLATCAMPLTMVFACRRCNHIGDLSAYPGRDSAQNICGGGLPLAHKEGQAASSLMAGDCEAAVVGISRLCVCRRQSTHEPVWLQSPGQLFMYESDRKRGGASSAGREGSRTGQGTQKRSVVLGKQRVLVANVSRFAPPPEESTAAIKVAVAPSHLSVLVVAMPTRRASPTDLQNLQKTLESLSRTTGYDEHSILMAHDDQDIGTANLAEDFKINRVKIKAVKTWQDPIQRTSRLYIGALKHASTMHFPNARTLVVVEEGVLVAPDFLWYFAQLEPVLHKDKTVWCVSACNENGLSPYVADPTVIMRTDWFGGGAWQARTDLLRDEIFPRWTGDAWDSVFKDPITRHQRQCLLPEVPRAVQTLPGHLADLPRHRRRAPLPAKGAVNDLFQFAPQLTLLNALPWVDLGNVSRLHVQSYEQLFRFDWPGEGLENARSVASVRALLESGRLSGTGPWCLIFNNKDFDTDNSWETVAHFFGLWPAVPIREAYSGIVRLRWRNSVLFLVPSSSPLTPLIAGRSRPLSPDEFLGSQLPVLLPANSELVGAGKTAISCNEECESRRLTCTSQDLFFINNCKALNTIFNCRSCENSEGPEQPAQVRRSGGIREKAQDRCLYNTNIAKFPPACEASHANTQRLCICRAVDSEGVRVKRAGSMDGAWADAAGAMAALRHYTKSEGASQSTEGPATPRPRNTTTTSTTLFTPVAMTLETQPGDIPILIIASSNRPQYLQDCLQALSNVDGYNPAQVLVSQDGPAEEPRRIAQEQFGVKWRLQKGDKRMAFGARVAKHYRIALMEALMEHFRTARSLLVMEEDLIASPDLLWFFAQLEPVLHRDKSLWCVSGWNELALGPYVADPTSLLRTDIFPAGAWLLDAPYFRKTVLDRWPTNNWEAFMRSPGGRGDKECILPEMPRVRHWGILSSDISTKTKQVVERDVTMFFSTSQSNRAVDLGNVSRVMSDAYHRDFCRQLREARLIESLVELPPPHVRVASSGTTTTTLRAGRPARPPDAPSEAKSWRLHYQSDQPQTDGSWKLLALYFKFTENTSPRSSYRGVVKLRWGDGTLFLVASGSPLVQNADGAPLHPLPESPLHALAFAHSSAPVLVASGAAIAASQASAETCTTICEDHGRECISADLPFINSCEALALIHDCEKCEASHGAEQPAFVSRRGHSKFATCLYNQNVAMYPPSCDAWHADTRRLCVCRVPSKPKKLELIQPVSAADRDQLLQMARNYRVGKMRAASRPSSTTQGLASAPDALKAQPSPSPQPRPSPSQAPQLQPSGEPMPQASPSERPQAETSPSVQPRLQQSPSELPDQPPPSTQQLPQTRAPQQMEEREPEQKADEGLPEVQP